MWTRTVVENTLDALDRMAQEPSDYEANVLDTLLRQIQQGRLPSATQHRLLCDMVATYLDDPALLRALQKEAPASATPP